MEFHKKSSIPLACIAFVLASIPLGITKSRSGKGVSLGMALIVAFIYYVFLTSGEALGKYGVIPPSLGMHLPNIVIALMGIILILIKLKD